MIGNLTITVIVDNRSDDPCLLTEHGLSFWIEADDRRILFDAEQSDMLFRNAETLGIDLRTADTLVLSHGHYDHTGSVAKLLELNLSLSVYCHPDVLIPRYSRQADGTVRPVGMPRSACDALHQCGGSMENFNYPAGAGNGIHNRLYYRRRDGLDRGRADDAAEMRYLRCDYPPGI